MRIDYDRTAGSDIKITNLVSFTFVVSAVIFAGALCRFLKTCCQRLSRKEKTEREVIAFTPVRRISQLRKCYSAPRMSTIGNHAVVHYEEIAIDTEKVPVQPEFRTIEGLQLRPRAPTDPGSSPTVKRQISAPVSSSLRTGTERPSPPERAGETSPLARRILSRDSSFNSDDILATDLEPQLYKKEASFQKFQTSSKNKCGTLDTEICFDCSTSTLKVCFCTDGLTRWVSVEYGERHIAGEDKFDLQVRISEIHHHSLVTVISINQVLHKQHADETNTYVSVKKIPDQKSRKTSIHTKAINPVYNDEFTFHIDANDDVSCHVLIYGLNHVDKFSTSYLRGEACLPLFQIDLDTRRRVQIPFVEIKRPFFTTMYPTYRTGITGCILISLKYEPWRKSIVVNPVHVTYVPRKRYVGYGKNVYVKVDLRHKGSRITKMKTQAIEMKKMAEDSFYEARFDELLTLEYHSIPAEECEIHISLNHYLFLKSSYTIGEVHLAQTESGYESTHFQSVLDSPEETVSVWYEMRGFTTPTAMEEITQ